MVSLEMCQDAAKRGNLGIAFMAGIHYMQTEKDLGKAFPYFSVAAEHGHAQSQYLLGNCYFEGSFMEKNVGMAMYWWEKAAAQGHKEAEKKLMLNTD